MKEVKKTSSGKKPTNHHVENKKTEEVKITKVSPVYEDNSKKENDDKKLIIFIAIAILVIVGTVIGLLVGCQRTEKEPEKPDDDIVVPVTDDDNKKEEKKDTEEDNKKVSKVVKTTTKIKEKYKIVFVNANGDKYSLKITEGKKLKKYVPSGYENCDYYYDKNLTKEVNFKEKPTSDTTIYLACELKKYIVNYYTEDGVEIKSETLIGTDTENYKVLDGSTLSNDENEFFGWATSSGSKTITYKANQLIDIKNDLSLYAVLGSTTIVYKNEIVGKTEENNDIENKEQIELEENTEKSNQNEVKNVDEVLTGDEIVIEESDLVEETKEEVVNEVEIAYTSEEIENYTLPETPSEVGLDTPTYFVPSEEETETSKKIVSDEVEELQEKEIKLGDVEGNTPEWYVPKVDDNVEEKEYEFTGWTTKEENESTGEVENKPVDENYKPEKGKTNEIDANWDLQEEDKAPQESESESVEM